jgi:hypothetical protein
VFDVYVDNINKTVFKKTGFKMLAALNTMNNQRYLTLVFFYREMSVRVYEGRTAMNTHFLNRLCILYKKTTHAELRKNQT